MEKVTLRFDATTEGRRAFDAFSALTDLHHDLRAELTASGVPSHSIDSLYPFELADHLPRICELLNQQHLFQAICLQLGRADVERSLRLLPHPAFLLAQRQLEELAIESNGEEYHLAKKEQAGVQPAYRQLATLTKRNSKFDSMIDSELLLKNWLRLLVFLYAHASVAPQLLHVQLKEGEHLRRHVETTRSLIAILPALHR